jgi:hypothetical protein
VHAWHSEPHALLQQTPSVQKPLEQSDPTLHAWPWPFVGATHWPLLQLEPPPHCTPQAPQLPESL